MQEMYTFSRALHLMRYVGATMKPNDVKVYFRVKDGGIQRLGEIDVKWVDCVNLPMWAIMGSWVEVK